MLDFISHNMAQALPLAACFLLGVWLVQKGLDRITSIKIYPFYLFLAYWLLISSDDFKGIGPTVNLDWIDLVGIYSPVIGIVVFVVCLVVSWAIKSFKGRNLQRESDEHKKVTQR
jgi:hypothetical protein